MSILTIEGVDTYYAKHQVLRSIAFSVPDHSVTLLLGRNGMGKTTTLRTIMGLTPPKRGTIQFKDLDIACLPPHRIARAGVGYVPEGRQIFPHLTVAENLRMAELTGRSGAWTTDALLDQFPILRERADQTGRSLSGGEQQQLAIARALAGNPELLILDEPSQGLAPRIVEEVSALLLRLRDSGLAILLVEQNVQMAKKIGEHVVVLNKGHVVFEGSSTEFAQDSEVQSRHLAL